MIDPGALPRRAGAADLPGLVELGLGVARHHTEIDPLFTYRINPFSAFHVGSTHDFNSYQRLGTPNETFYRQSERQIFFKFQYLLRV